ncbi:MAG TPA: hypothetical protein VIS06_02075 [Mycobacteriales bacterium]
MTDAVLRDVLLPQDPPVTVRVEKRDLHGVSDIVVTLSVGGMSVGFAIPPLDDRTELLVAIADRAQDALVDLLAVGRPACRAAGHDDPLTPTVDQDTAVWRCPKSAYQVEVTRYSGA